MRHVFISVVLSEEEGVKCVYTCGADRGGRCDMQSGRCSVSNGLSCATGTPCDRCT